MNSDVTVWRYLETGAHNGAFNMATDEALTRLGQDAPILRVYRWQPYTISLGFHQQLAGLDLQKCAHDGIGVVRRPTGGRAIYHAHEVTYSVIIPRSHHLYACNSTELYNRISTALVTGLRRLDIDLSLERVQQSSDFAGYQRQFACFATSAQYEVHLQGKKLIGSAQRRFKNGLLQHGSIILGDEHLALAKYLVVPARVSTPASEVSGAASGDEIITKTQSGLEEKTISIERALRRKVSFHEVAAHLPSGFEEVFGIALRPDQLLSEERKRIKALLPNFINSGGNP